MNDKIKSAIGAARYVVTGDDGKPLLLENGFWIGLGADRLTLGPRLIELQISRLLQAQDPHTGVRLRPRKGCLPGMFVDFAAPKEISLIAMIREDVIAVFRDAIHATAEFAIKLIAPHDAGPTCENNLLERMSIPAGEAICSVTIHFWSRASDPQLHGHVCVPNLAWDPSRKRWQAADMSALFEFNSLFQQYFRARLSDGLNRLGIGLVPLRTMRYVTLIPECITPELVAKFSKRSQQIHARISHDDQRMALLLEKRCLESLSLKETEELGRLTNSRRAGNKHATMATRSSKCFRSEAIRKNDFFDGLTSEYLSQLEAASVTMPIGKENSCPTVRATMERIAKMLSIDDKWLISTSQLLTVLLAASPTLSSDSEWPVVLQTLSSGLTSPFPGFWTTHQHANLLAAINVSLKARTTSLGGVMSMKSNVPCLERGVIAVVVPKNPANRSSAFLKDMKELVSRLRRHETLYLGGALSVEELRPPQSTRPLPAMAQYWERRNLVMNVRHLELSPTDKSDLKTIAILLRDTPPSATIIIWLNDTPNLTQFFRSSNSVELIETFPPRRKLLSAHAKAQEVLQETTPDRFIESLETAGQIDFSDIESVRLTKIVTTGAYLWETNRSFLIVSGEAARGKKLEEDINRLLIDNGHRHLGKGCKCFQPIANSLDRLAEWPNMPFKAVAIQNLPGIGSGTWVDVVGISAERCSVLLNGTKYEIPKDRFCRFRPFAPISASLAIGDWVRPTRRISGSRYSQRKRLDCRRSYRINDISDEYITLSRVGRVSLQDMALEPSMVISIQPGQSVPKRVVDHILIDLTAAEISQRGGTDFLRQIFALAKLGVRMICDDAGALTRVLLEGPSRIAHYTAKPIASKTPILTLEKTRNQPLRQTAQLIPE